jgi:hypothetical protein
MLNRLLRFGDKLLKLSGTAALYGCTSLFLASVILGLYLKYAWQIDHAKWVKILAVAQGLELADIQQAVQDRIAEMSFDEVLERRAKRIREDEFQRDSIEKQIVVAPPPPVEEPKPDEKTAKADDSREKAFEKKVKDYLDQAKATGLAEETRLLEKMEPEQAKEVIRRLWKDGAIQRVLTMLLAMEDKNRGEILYSMQADEELKDLCDILQRIGNGEPLSSVIEDAAKQ